MTRENPDFIEVKLAATSYGDHPVVVPSDLIFVDMDGAIAVDLPPGRYELVRLPHDPKGDDGENQKT